MKFSMNNPLTKEQIMKMDDLDAVWFVYKSLDKPILKDAATAKEEISFGMPKYALLFSTNPNRFKVKPVIND
jgi:hypothetical protein